MSLPVTARAYYLTIREITCDYRREDVRLRLAHPLNQAQYTPLTPSTPNNFEWSAERLAASLATVAPYFKSKLAYRHKHSPGPAFTLVMALPLRSSQLGDPDFASADCVTSISPGHAPNFSSIFPSGGEIV